MTKSQNQTDQREKKDEGMALQETCPEGTTTEGGGCGNPSDGPKHGYGAGGDPEHSEEHTVALKSKAEVDGLKPLIHLTFNINLTMEKSGKSS